MFDAFINNVYGILAVAHWGNDGAYVRFHKRTFRKRTFATGSDV